MQTTKRAFTLIELLVVIAIIAILAAILFPVFAQAKKAAKGAASISNVKQLGTSSFIYSGDFDDVFVSEYITDYAPDYGWLQSWIMLQMPYTKSYAIFKDPSDTNTTNTLPGYDSGPKTSYVANGMLSGDCVSGSNPFWRFRGVVAENGNASNGSVNWHENATRSQTQINEIAGTVLFAARSKPVVGSHNGKIEGAFSPWEKTILGVASSTDSNGNMGPLPGQRNGGFAAPDPTYLGALDRFYGAGMMPVTYTDGHTKMVKPEQTVDISGGIADGNAGGCSNKRYLNQWDALR